MATKTTNYGLTKPDEGDVVDIGVLNDNFDVIDEQMRKNETATPSLATTEEAGIVKPDGETIKVDEDGTIRGANTYVLPVATERTLGGIKLGKNVTMSADGKLNAYADFETDAVPTKDSKNVPLSGGTYNAIKAVEDEVGGLSSQVLALVTGLTWKPAVETYDEIATSYDSPEKGWTILCKDTGDVWHFDGETWIQIFVLLIPIATDEEVSEILEG